MALETNVDPSYLYYEGFTQTTPGESSYTVAFADYQAEEAEAYWETLAERMYDASMAADDEWARDMDDYYDGPHY